MDVTNSTVQLNTPERKNGFLRAQTQDAGLSRDRGYQEAFASIVT